ncbi:MAG TPA: methyltransferase domain-containing protein [Pseudomonadota bacterium]|nr:methyltransferase domain-containing protein [Pseudomonadota bacterium]
MNTATSSATASATVTATAIDRNRAIYEDLWVHYELFPCEGWTHAWTEIEPLYKASPDRTLEIGPGMFPHVPILGTHFVDLSQVALSALAKEGGHCVKATCPLPYEDGRFDLVCLFEVIEHVADDQTLLAEVARVLAKGGHLFLSCPLNPAYFTYYDKVMGHERRYTAELLASRLRQAGFAIEKVCPRHDRMDRWFGAMFGFGMRYLPGFTSRIVRGYLPKVAALPWTWIEGDDLAEAETRGGVTLRAQKA